MIDLRGRTGVRVYVAGPYTLPNQASNVAHAIEVADVLIRNKHAPFVPHLFHFADMHRPQSYETWLSLDLTWLAQCEALIRIPGFSRGADIEVVHAKALGFPTFTSVLDFLDACRLHPMNWRTTDA